MAISVPPMFMDRYMALSDKQRLQFDMQYQSEAKDPTSALICSLFGVFHFYMGQIGLGIVLIVTAGGCGIWSIIVLIGAKKAAEQHNLTVAQRMFATMS